MRLRSRGFTLIEAIVAMVLLLLGILMVAQLFTAAIFVRQKGNNLAIVENAITTKFEAMRRTPFEELRSQFEGTFNVTDPANPTRVVGTGQVTMQQLGSVLKVMKVTISVSVGKVRPSQVSLTSTTYVAER